MTKTNANELTQAQLDQLGPLAKLLGTWEGDSGWNIIAVPSPGSQPDQTGAFDLLVRPYKETLTFTAVADPVRNRGGALDQFIGAIQYEQSIVDKETGEALHVENGMWLNLTDIKSDSGTPPKPDFSIARSSTIPHGDSVLALGNVTIEDGAPTIPDFSAMPPDIGTGVMGYLDVYMHGQPIPMADPNLVLKKTLLEQEVVSTTSFMLDTENQGGINNIPFVVRHTNTTAMQCGFWVETVKKPNSDETFQQLQYSQLINLEFQKKFGGAPGLISWPHINLNTLTKA